LIDYIYAIYAAYHRGSFQGFAHVLHTGADRFRYPIGWPGLNEES